MRSKKLIEVALPLEAINREAAKEKLIRHEHPSTLHLWWARRPLAICRAVIFASLVDDPSSHPDQFPTEKLQEQERTRLFKLIEELAKWERRNDEDLLENAKQEIAKSTANNPPNLFDPFCGGGAIPIEGQRLGLKAYASDLNPVAVMITKAAIDLPTKFTNLLPISNPQIDKKSVEYTKCQGLHEDIKYYGDWMLQEAEKRIGTYYPKATLPKKSGGTEVSVIAWLWTRTVKCPNPACGFIVPLARSFRISTKKGKEAWVEVHIDKKKRTARFEVHKGKGNPSNGTMSRKGGICLSCKAHIPFDHLRSEGRRGKLGKQLMAIVTEGKGGRIYLSPDDGHEKYAEKANPQNVPDTDLPEQALGFRVQLYGMRKHRDLFTNRQLLALTTFSDLVEETRKKIIADWKKEKAARVSSRIQSDQIEEYADTISVYLAFVVDRCADYWSSLIRWQPANQQLSNTFSRHALSMLWDFAEANPFSNKGGSFANLLEWTIQSLRELPTGITPGICVQAHAIQAASSADQPLVSTDPPYYDNIGYADLSDYFYVWLRRSIGKRFPSLFSTVLVPKSDELIASPYRFEGDKEKAKTFFETGLGSVFAKLRETAHPDFPITIHYAFKQNEVDESEDDDIPGVSTSTGWETLLEGLISARLQINGTWPTRSELTNRTRAIGSNALASSIVLVCRPRPDAALVASRRDYIGALKKELPPALQKLQQGNIAPVDLAQAAIGPGMAIFSRYSSVLEADGSKMPVHVALQLINREIDSYFTEQDGEMDSETRFCLAWFNQRGLKPGPFGEADVLARAKNTSVAGLVEAGVLHSKAGAVRLLKNNEYSPGWQPARDRRLTVWECAHQLINVLERKGERGAAALIGELGPKSEEVRALAYRLYSICDRNRWSEEAQAYNSLVLSWPEIQLKIAA